MKNPYDVLRIQQNASAEQIRVTYRVLAKELHPDVNPKPDAAQRFKEVKRAFEVLSDPVKRRQYDAELSKQSEAHRGQDGTRKGRSAESAEVSRSPRHKKTTAPRQDTSNGISEDEREQVGAFLTSQLQDMQHHARDELIRAGAKALKMGPHRARKVVNRVLADGVRRGLFVVDETWSSAWAKPPRAHR